MHDSTYLSGSEQKKNKKSVLFLSTLPPPYHGASMSSEMCQNILRSDNNFEVQNIKLNYSIEVSDLGKVTFKKLYGILVIRKQIKKSIKKFNPDIIYFVPAVTGFALIRDYYFLKVIKNSTKNKIILHLRGQFQKKDWKNPFTQYIIRDLLRCNKVIVLGPELISNLHEAIPMKDVYVLPNAIAKTLSDQEFELINRSKNNRMNLSLLFLSNMKMRKGWFKVLEACRLLNDFGVNYKCHFVGSWPSKKESKKFYSYVEQNDLAQHILYHGQLLNNEKNKILSEVDILIFPTENDAFGRVIIEGMEFGLPVISNGCGTIPSIIEHGKTGFILKDNTAIEITEYILKLQDKNYRILMGIKGRERFLEKFTLDAYRNKFIAIINQD